MTEERALRKVRVGMVVSDKMAKTVTVAIEDNVKHPVYGKIMFEMGGVDVEIAREAMRLASHKLPIKCKFITKSEEE